LNVAKRGNPSYELLEFFQYKQFKDLTFQLTEKQTEQLRLLSLLDLFNQKVVKYDTIKEQLKIESDIDLEYFVILLIERGWAEAKLDQASRVVKVEACKSRLYETQQELQLMADALDKWNKNVIDVLTKIDTEIISREKSYRIKREKDLKFETELEKLSSKVSKKSRFKKI
jgi:hypothetical protein